MTTVAEPITNLPITPRPKRRGFQFKLRTLLLASILIASVLGIAREFYDRAQRQKRAAEELTKAGLTVLYAYEVDDEMPSIRDGFPKKQSFDPRSKRQLWLDQRIGVDFFHTVAAVSGSVGGKNLPINRAAESLRRLRGLRSLQLFLSYDAEEAIDLSFLPELPIRHLTLRYHRRSPNGWSVVAKCQRLEYLNLCQCGGVTDGLLELLATNVPSLQALNVKGTEVSDTGVRHLEKLSRLRMLSLCGDKCTDRSLASLSRLTELEDLDITYLSISDSGIEQLGSLTKLKVLLANSTQITGASFDQWQCKGTLRLLEVGHNFSVQGLRNLQDFTALERLTVRMSNDAPALPADIRWPSSLKKLHVSGPQTDIQSVP